MDVPPIVSTTQTAALPWHRPSPWMKKTGRLPPGTFDQPGKYLVICTTFVHFQFAKMYAFVIVE